MLNLSTVAAPGAKVGYTILRRKDGAFWNPDLRNFGPVPVPKPALPLLPESTAPYLGLYSSKIPDDITRTWVDGVYECWFTDTVTGITIDGYMVRMTRGDDTPSVFQCSAEPTAPPGPVVPVLTNGWFNEPILPPKTNSAAAPQSWTATGSIHHSSNGAPGCEQNPAAPDEGQFVVVEGQGAISQAIGSWAEGTYAVYFKFAKRASSGNHSLVMRVDDEVIGPWTVTDKAWLGVLSKTFKVTAGDHTLGFGGADGADPKAATLLDRVTLMRTA